MISVADIRSADTHIDTETADHIAGLWNTAYPHMRAALTAVIDGNRRFLAEADRWQLSDERKARVARTIKDNERWRRELGQLDRSALRMCNRSSVGEFSVSGALILVTRAIAAFSFGSPHLGHAYRLAAVLADVVSDQDAVWRADQRQDREAAR